MNSFTSLLNRSFFCSLFLLFILFIFLNVEKNIYCHLHYGIPDRPPGYHPWICIIKLISTYFFYVGDGNSLICSILFISPYVFFYGFIAGGG